MQSFRLWTNLPKGVWFMLPDTTGLPKRFMSPAVIISLRSSVSKQALFQVSQGLALIFQALSVA
jgi:hypothetical protein